MLPDIALTHAAADKCAAQLGTDRETARRWLRDQLSIGRLVEVLPAPHSARQSPSGRFWLVEGVFALPLVFDQVDPRKLVAVGCFFFPAWLSKHGLGSGHIDPFALKGVSLLEHVHFSQHCVRRFQERCEGSPDLAAAEAQLRQSIASDVRAVSRRPEWSRSQNTADFFLVAWDEFCFPIQRYASDGNAFEALTLMHRSQHVFALQGPALAEAVTCSSTALSELKDIVPAEDQPEVWLRGQIAMHGRLLWDPPQWHDRHPDARFYLEIDRYVLPVAWDRTRMLRPLEAVGFRPVKAPLSRRILWWLTGRNQPTAYSRSPIAARAAQFSAVRKNEAQGHLDAQQGKVRGA